MRQKFEQSYAMVAAPFTLFNLANAQGQTDQFLVAKSNYLKFRDTSVTSEENTRSFRKFAKERLAQIDQLIPTVTIKLVGFTASVVVALDGRALSPAQLGAPVVLDPGEHVLTAPAATRAARELWRAVVGLVLASDLGRTARRRGRRLLLQVVLHRQFERNVGGIDSRAQGR